MCEPTLVFMAVSTAFSAYQQYSQGQAQARATQQAAANNAQIAEYNAQVNEQNAKIQEDAAKDAIKRGAHDAATIRENTRKANAMGRASMGSSGLLSDTGNNADLLGDNIDAGYLNALTTMNNAQREAHGYNVNAMNARSQATGTRFEAQVGLNNAAYQSKIQKNNGLLSAGGTLLSGGVAFGQAGGFSKSTWKAGS